MEFELSLEDTLPSIDASDALQSGDYVTTIDDEMRESFASYAWSVIISRALPDARDGLKPVHRRIIYAMKVGGFTSEGGYKKCARIVGDVMGKFHPHGDASIYDALVRMAQGFSMSAPLVDGQGNFGSIDGDNPAAMRYTEARMEKIADVGLTQDLDEDIVDFQPTYDESNLEPRVLAARFPNMLVNGGSGIAVGMATNIPPHNLSEVVSATLAFIDNPAMTVDELMSIMPGPDFPTGGIIQGRAAIRHAYATGHGSISINSVAVIEDRKSGTRIVITELPYAINKKTLHQHMAELVTTKVIEGVTDVRDESDHLIRMVIDVKKDHDATIVLNAFRQKTALMSSFSVNMNCLNHRRQPKVMGVLEILTEFVMFRRDAIRRRTTFRMEAARDAMERQVALYASTIRLDDVLSIIRGAEDTAPARAALMAIEFHPVGEFSKLLYDVDPDAPTHEVFHLSHDQASLILKMALGRLTGLQQTKIIQEARDLLVRIHDLQNILENPGVLDDVMRAELQEIRALHPNPRRTRIEDNLPENISEEDQIEDKQVVITLTRGGYVKASLLDSFREQNRGGKGKTGMSTKEDDVVAVTLTCSLRTHLLFFTDRGIAHTVKAWHLPLGLPSARGRHINNIIKAMKTGESIATLMPMPSREGQRSMLFVTDIGEVRRNNASDFARTNTSGKIAMKLEDDSGRPLANLIAVLDMDDDDDVVLCTRRGKCIRFPLVELRTFNSRASTGVRGISLSAGDKVISATVLRHSDATASARQAYLAGGTAPARAAKDGEEETMPFTLDEAGMERMRLDEQWLLTVTTTGHGKRFSDYGLRVTQRGGDGVFIGAFDRAPGELAACFPVNLSDAIVMVSNGGQLIRTRIDKVKGMFRVARGVTLFDLPDGEHIVDVSRVEAIEGADSEDGALE